MSEAEIWQQKPSKQRENHNSGFMDAGATRGIQKTLQRASTQFDDEIIVPYIEEVRTRMLCQRGVGRVCAPQILLFLKRAQLNVLAAEDSAEIVGGRE